jgi:hypothetical protein
MNDVDEDLDNNHKSANGRGKTCRRNHLAQLSVLLMDVSHVLGTQRCIQQRLHHHHALEEDEGVSKMNQTPLGRNTWYNERHKTKDKETKQIP